MLNEELPLLLLCLPSVTLVSSGTGKTTAVVELILQCAARGQRLLVCAPSNVAVDNIVGMALQQTDRLMRLATSYRLLSDDRLLSVVYVAERIVLARSMQQGAKPPRIVRLGHPARLSPQVPPTTHPFWRVRGHVLEVRFLQLDDDLRLPLLSVVVGAASS